MPCDEKKTRLNSKVEGSQKVRYPALYRLSKIYRYLAFFSGFCGIVLVAVGISLGSFFVQAGGVLTLIIGVVVNLAISEIILLLIDIESSTRKASFLIEQMNGQHGGSSNSK